MISTMDSKGLLYLVLLFGLVTFLGFAGSSPVLEYIENGSNEDSDVIPDTVDEDKLADLQKDPEEKALEYLMNFGYIGKKAVDPMLADITDGSVRKEAIKRFQQMAGLPQTGELDGETIKMMAVPRCGVIDEEAGRKGMKRRRKRYAIQGSKWQGNSLRYYIQSNPADGSPSSSQVDSELRRAFKVWSDVSPLRFTKVSSNNAADITILFGKRSHGDGNPFDGRGNTLAHAYFPQFGGDAHFDDDENFTVGTRRGTNLFQVAAHEFGHSLGLAHSSVRDALMAPFYRGYVPNFRLHDDDIRGIQKIYGKNTLSPDPTPTPPPPPTRAPPPPPTAAPTRGPTAGPTRGPTRGPIPPPAPGSCQDQFEAITSISTSVGSFTLAFSGSQYFHINDNGPVSGYPRSIQSGFSGLTSVDAAYSYRETSGARRTIVLLFKDSRVSAYQYVSRGYRLLNQYAISSLIRGFPASARVDALFMFPGYNRVYVFSGNQYYRLRGNNVDRGYPRSISAWNLPSSVTQISSVFQYSNGKTYFFVGDRYYRYNGQTFRVDTSRTPYPRNTGQWWLNCRSNSIVEDPDLTTRSPKEDDWKPFDDDDFTTVPTFEHMNNLGNNSGDRTSGVVQKTTITAAFVIALLAQHFFF